MEYGTKYTSPRTYKIILLCIMALPVFASMPAMATETVIYSEGFEESDGNYTHTGTLDQWQWGTPNYTMGPATAHQGTKVWGTNLVGNVPQNSDSYLTSPAIAIPALGANQIARVRFFAWIAVDYMYDRGEFQVSKDGTNWETKAELLYRMSGNWSEYYFDVSDYAGGNIYLRFRLRADGSNSAFYDGIANMSGLYIDDVAMIIADSPAIRTNLTLEAWEDQSQYASCPWLYSGDGSNYVKDNDIYSTARGAGNEYIDYYKMNKQLVASDGKYSLKLMETDDESSYTDMVKLITVDHSPEVKISTDENGNILTYINPSAPASAIDNQGNNVLSQISAEDNTGAKVYQDDYIDLDFSNLNTSNGATLVLRALGFQMDGEPGTPTDEKPYIYIQTQEDGNWVTRNVFYPRMDWATNAYNLAPYLTESKLVRLLIKSCHEGKYHIIDYVGLDTSAQAATTINTLSPATAISSVNGDILNKISTSDDSYASMAPTESISLEFSEPPMSGETRDFIFVSEGYYLQMGTFFIYTWDGSNWAQRDGWSIEGSGDKTRNFDLSLWLPDPTGEYKVRIWQDYWYEPAGIDYVGLTKGSINGTMIEAYDLLKSQNVSTRLQASDDIRDGWSMGEGRPLRNRWVEVNWTGLGTNVPPSTNNSVTISNTYGPMPVFEWSYYDTNGDLQISYEVQVWTGAGGTGLNVWNPPVGDGSVRYIVYTGPRLVNNRTYYARIKLFDGADWGQWSEASWTYNSNYSYNITSFSPPTPVYDTTGATRTFNITMDMPANFTWYINGTKVQTNNNMEAEASYTNTSASLGTWNVAAFAWNENIDALSWNENLNAFTWNENVATFTWNENLNAFVWSEQSGIIGMIWNWIVTAPTVPPAPPSSGGSGASTGGSGVITKEPYDNIANAERAEGDLKADNPVTYTFPSVGQCIFEIVITGKDNENKITIRVEELRDTSKLVKEPPSGSVYKNVNLWAGTKKIKEAIIRFRVKNSWITSNGFTSSDVKMLRWDGTQWVKLETKETSKDSQYTTYEAKTYAFSSFAILGEKSKAQPADTSGASTTSISTVTQTSESMTPAATGAQIQPPITLNWILYVLILAGIVVVVYFFVKKKEE